MIVYNFGSINIDHVYRVPHFVRPGETMTSNAYQQVLGGKGANQSIALARANCDVKHIGAIEKSDTRLLTTLQDFGVDTSSVQFNFGFSRATRTNSNTATNLTTGLSRHRLTPTAQPRK